MFDCPACTTVYGSSSLSVPYQVRDHSEGAAQDNYSSLQLQCVHSLQGFKATHCQAMVQGTSCPLVGCVKMTMQSKVWWALSRPGHPDS